MILVIVLQSYAFTGSARHVCPRKTLSEKFNENVHTENHRWVLHSGKEASFVTV